LSEVIQAPLDVALQAFGFEARQACFLPGRLQTRTTLADMCPRQILFEQRFLGQQILDRFQTRLISRDRFVEWAFQLSQITFQAQRQRFQHGRVPDGVTQFGARIVTGQLTEFAQQ
jgi:hypothetical protein